MKEKNLAGLFIVLAGICWGIIGLFSRKLNQGGLSAIDITGLRCMITFISIFMYMYIRDKSKLKIKLKDIWIFLGTGICSIILFNVCYFSTISRATLSVASLLLYTAPCFVVILSAFIFKEKITLQKLAALGLAFFGCMLSTGIFKQSDSDNIQMIAVITGIGSGFGYGLYSIFGRIGLRKYDPLTVTCYTFLVATVVIIPFMSYSHVSVAYNDMNYFGIVALLLGILSTLIPYLFYTKGLKHIEAGKASIMAFVEPMVATLTGVIVYGEQLTISGSIGILLIFSSLILLYMPWPFRKKRDSEASVEM